MADAELANGNFVMPIVTEGIRRGSPSFFEEFFGPVFNLYKVDSVEQALEVANDSDYGLAATVFTQTAEKG
jgi:acyl-CoA reductase-like NAD-dependent aldehyde dehydrogenase